MSLHFRVEHDNSGQSPTVLKTLSDRTLVGGGARNICASGDNTEETCSSFTRKQDHPDG